MIRAAVVLAGAMLMLGLPMGAPAGAPDQRIREGDAVRVFYDAGRSAAARRIENVSPGIFRELENATGLPFDFRPVVIAASDRDAFKALGGREAFVAFAMPARRQVVIDLSRFDNQPALFRPVLKHEYAHLLLHRHIAPALLPRWLDEGIAQHLSDGLSEYLPGRLQLVLGEALAADRIFPLSTLEKHFPADDNGLQLAYEQSRSMVGYMARRFGDRFLPALVERMAGGAAADQAFRALSGISLEELAADWRRQQSAPLSWLVLAAGQVYAIVFFLAALATFLAFVRYRRRRREYDAEEDDEPVRP
jgi:hypothetical protein